jgi:exopolyphosphatase / guanosine-5'-triphosphate,3'-diphosphate pyrophosphatase
VPTDPGRDRAPAWRRLATIDLGTNTVRMLVAETDGASWRPVRQAQRVTRLGEGQGSDGILREAPMTRTVNAVGEFVATARALGAEQVRIVATSAARDGANSLDLAARVRAATGEPVEIVSGQDEARLTLRGVEAGLPGLERPFVLLDIGGGSTELVLVQAATAPLAVSLRLGVVRLAERFTDAGPVRPDQFEAMIREAAGQLADGVPSAMSAPGARTVVGTGGTVTSLAALDLGLAAYDATRVHGLVLTREAVERLRTRLSAMTVAARATLPSVEPGRADLLVPGAAICLSTLDHLRLPSMLVSDQGLREGILLDLLERGAPREVDRPRGG